MKTFLTHFCVQLAIAITLVACSAFRPSTTPSPLPDVLSSSPVVGNPSPLPTATGEPFAKGVDKAASATSLAQSAQSAEDWNLVLTQWQRAIAFMKAVPPSSPNYAAAQKLLVAYQQDLALAQEQFKRGGARQSSSAAKGNTSGGIPLIAGGQPSTSPTSGQPSTSPSPASDAEFIAMATINTLLQQQAIFFAKHNRFAGSIAELGGSTPANTSSYTYSTRALQLKLVIAVATAKQKGLSSYAGTFRLVKDNENNDRGVTTICSTSKPTDVSPVPPPVVGQELQCPSESKL